MDNTNIIISLVIPVFNEKDSIGEMLSYISQNGGVLFGNHSYEIVLVDDGSTDGSWELIEDCSRTDTKIKGIRFSRNFGKEAAIIAGLAYSLGDAVITMDADMQHPPEKISEFISKWEGGAKIVEGIKSNRGKESGLYTFFASKFYGAISCALGKNLINTSDYKLLDRDVVGVILSMPEKEMFYRAISSWVGFTTDVVEFEVQNRVGGKSKWSATKLVSYAIRNVTSFSSAPLQIITICSALFFFLTIVGGVQTMVKWADGTAIEGFATVILLQLITGCLIMFALGLIGYYIAKLYEQAQDRPRYIIENRTETVEKKVADEQGYYKHN